MNTLEQILNVTNEVLDKLDTSYMKSYKVEHDPSYFHLFSGSEHYRLLMYVSSILDDEILFDVGTNRCMSAIALSFNKKNKVKSYDIEQVLTKNPILENVNFCIGDSREDGDILSSKFIFLDVYHDGEYENKFYNFLLENKWKGLLMLDDIHLNAPMKNFWQNISEKKIDITKKGHWSGTGLVVFE
jgi:hypothetical protein